MRLSACRRPIKMSLLCQIEMTLPGGFAELAYEPSVLKRAWSNNGSGFVGQKGDDLYAGRNGNVYRKTDGGWQEYNRGNGWSDVGGGNQAGQLPSGGRGDGAGGNRPSTQPSQRPSGGDASAGQLDREARARSEGNQRTRDYSNYQRSGGSSSRSSYGGGGSRGGGSRGGGGGGRRR